LDLNESSFSRRSFLQTTGLAGVTALAASSSSLLASAETAPGASVPRPATVNSRALKIALEEHVAIPDAPAASALAPDIARLIAEMDTWGIELAVLSPKSGRPQDIPDRAQAVENARRINDYLAAQVARQPTRLQAFAALPLQDPQAAARELERSVKELGLRGAMIKGFSQLDRPENKIYCDAPQLWDLWGTMASLGVPMYLHPRYPANNRADNLDGHPYFQGSGWYYGYETATHALRLMASGLFDKYPNFTVILGHLGEMLPSVMWRVDHRLESETKRFGAVPARHPLDYYFRNNFYVTTSGNFCAPSLANALEWLGADRIMFSVDYPWEKVPEAALWFDNLGLNQSDWVRIARGNAERVLRLGAFARPA
jgi:2,3-dihydroxybenzoate decarboxylase